jgi:hypothetical protein
MGKVTLYHPIPLTVLRGAALYDGFKIGRIKQVWADPETTYAEYIIELVSMPDGLDEMPNKVIGRQLQHAFMNDVIIRRVWQTGSGSWQARINVDLNVIKDEGNSIFDKEGETLK